MIPISDKVAFLRSPAAYAGQVGDVDCRETHMSWVFLAGNRVYKLKKPVRYSFLDFTTLAARERNCREEVRLNRRLAPDVYLGVVALSLDANRDLVLGSGTQVVDWLVEMWRLPEDRMLDRAMADGTVASQEVAAVADLLVGFYRALPAEAVTPEDYLGQFTREQAVTETVLCDNRFALDREGLERAFERVRRGLEGDAPLLEMRARSGCIVEGHGDLRPEHVCLTKPPVIFDCLEFSRALRLVDPFDELAFLALECQILGDGWVAAELIERCAPGLGRRPPVAVMEFYWAYRACLRARLALVHLLEPHPRHREKWLPLAQRYLAVAATPQVMPGLPLTP